MYTYTYIYNIPGSLKDSVQTVSSGMWWDGIHRM